VYEKVLILSESRVGYQICFNKLKALEKKCLVHTWNLTEMGLKFDLQIK